MIQIIPAIDLIDGACVRLTQGDYNKKVVYKLSPLDIAKQYEDVGITRLHLVDLDGAKAKHIVNWKILEQIATKTKLIVDFGGGLQSNKDLDIAFNCGASMVTGGSIAVKDRTTFESWISEYGPDKIILGADVKKDQVVISGWSEYADLEVCSFIKSYIKLGINKVISTDIEVDGMLTGPSYSLYEKLICTFPTLHITASGGVGSMDDIEKLEINGVKSVIVGKAIYEGKISMNDISNFHK